MDNRRDFLKKAILLSGAFGIDGLLPQAITKAAAIAPEAGSTYLDAEHIVILMQENRSFDHCFGSLSGVRGFNDPRAIRQPDGNLVWMQTNEAGETYVPFRFDITNTKATWMGSTPHSRSSQVDAWNYGKYDNWLSAKKVADKKYSGMPLTLGYYNREDIPFHYALADAFTVCDQHFCSVMSSTDPNRLYFWSGTIHGMEEDGRDVPRIRNDFPGLGKLMWTSFPERLQDYGVSWKVYQNEIEAGGGFKGEERVWLSNSGCNPLEWFEGYQVKFSSRYMKSVRRQIEQLPIEIEALKEQMEKKKDDEKFLEKARRDLFYKEEVLKNAHADLGRWNEENFHKLSDKEKELHRRAFTINDGDLHYHDLTTLNYKDGQEDRSLPIPKGDVLHQFRKDVEGGNLPTVSWLVAPWNFIDHPSTAWYGSLYMSEILNILTDNPEVWKKTIFIMTFDENDGYYDHIPPFVAPDPNNPATGRTSPGIDTANEFIYQADEIKNGVPEKLAREAPIGLGFRVPLIVASPWSRGGQVCSQVFDHTSTLQFLEKFIEGKFGKQIRDTNISDWRRTVTGDLTRVFNATSAEEEVNLPFLEKEPFIEKIYNARVKEAPTGIEPLSPAEISKINKEPLASEKMPKQETGVRRSCALPYELYADGRLSNQGKEFALTLSAKNDVFGKASAGSPFNLFFRGKMANGKSGFESVGSRSFAVKAGDTIEELFSLDTFESGKYHLDLHGPNGFYRTFKGSQQDPGLSISCTYEKQKGVGEKLTGNVVLDFAISEESEAISVRIIDRAYKNEVLTKVLSKGTRRVVVDLSKSHRWYDLSIEVDGFDHFERRYAGRVETGEAGISDPAMGRVI